MSLHQLSKQLILLKITKVGANPMLNIYTEHLYIKYLLT